MKMRHKKAGGGPVDTDWEKESEGGGKAKAYDAQGSHVEKEADEKKHGGAVKKKKRADGGKVEGDKPKHRMDRACRKSGGRVGSDMSPLSSAHKAETVKDHKTDDL